MYNSVLLILISCIIGLILGGYLKLAMTEKYLSVSMIGAFTLPMFVLLMIPCYSYFRREYMLDVKKGKLKKRHLFVGFMTVYMSSYNDFTFLLAESALKVKKVTVRERKVRFRTFRNSMQKEWYEEVDGALML